MSNKRKHQLERMVRKEFCQFNNIIYPYNLGYKFLEQITRLMHDRIAYLRYARKINYSEGLFMTHCVSAYFVYCYKNMLKYIE